MLRNLGQVWSEKIRFLLWIEVRQQLVRCYGHSPAGLPLGNVGLPHRQQDRNIMAYASPQNEQVPDGVVKGQLFPKKENYS